MGDSYTIQISSNLINRLVSDENKLKKVKKPQKKTQQESRQPPSDTDAASTNPLNAASSGKWPLQPPIYVPATAPAANLELEAIRSVLHESEKVVERLQKQEDNMVQELTQRVKELHDKEFKLPYKKPMPCFDEKSACQKCYEENLKDTLKCSHLVRLFVDCAREAWMQASSSNE